LFAAQEGHEECLSILLAHGAKVDKANKVSVRGVCSIAYSWDVALWHSVASVAFALLVLIFL
jgi:hypothetical protein